MPEKAKCENSSSSLPATSLSGGLPNGHAAVFFEGLWLFYPEKTVTGTTQIVAVTPGIDMHNYPYGDWPVGCTQRTFKGNLDLPSGPHVLGLQNDSKSQAKFGNLFPPKGAVYMPDTNARFNIAKNPPPGTRIVRLPMPSAISIDVFVANGQFGGGDLNEMAGPSPSVFDFATTYLFAYLPDPQGGGRQLNSRWKRNTHWTPMDALPFPRLSRDGWGLCIGPSSRDFRLRPVAPAAG